MISSSYSCISLVSSTPINIEQCYKSGELYFYNEPIDIKSSQTEIKWTSKSDTDFWQRTHYGFRRDTGHCLFMKKSGDFTLQSHVHYVPANQYDQAGLIVYYDSEHWVKTSAEGEVDEPFNLGSVVTDDGFSDWATQPFTEQIVDLEFKIMRQGQDFLVYYRSYGSEKWIQLRMGHLSIPIDCEMQVGIYSCSPITGGFESTFDNFICC
ncbi:hypothetical protein WA158_002488 [Blastocystis sp. Blastoise]